MSIKSLLQLILLFLIFIIIAGIYFLYFYSGPLKSDIFNSNEVDKITSNKIFKDNVDQEILEDVIVPKKEVENKKEFNDKALNKKQKSKMKDEDLNEDSSGEIKNLTKEIEYVTSNSEGDIFKILAKYGKTNIENSSILDLEKVDGIISSNKRSQIYIKSDLAKYNYDNQNSQFYSNVEIKYDNKIITCDNLDLQINKNYAIAYNNVEVKDKNSVMKAQIVTLNILTKDIQINSQEKIKIITN